MITLDSLSSTSYKVTIRSDDLTEEERIKLLRQRDLFPAEFLHRLINLLPSDQEFDQYDHYNMTLHVK
jgi:hypothetical protein